VDALTHIDIGYSRQVATLHSTIILSDDTREISPEVLGGLDCCNYSFGVANGNKAGKTVMPASHLLCTVRASESPYSYK
jgi:hypothetical protein